LDDALAQGVRAGRISATTDANEALRKTDVSFVCVGTPSLDSGALDLKFVRRVCEQIGAALRDKTDRHTVVLRSTMLPGSTETEAIPVLEQHSSKRVGADFGVCFNPEFLREGTAIADYYDPPRTVIGQREALSGDIVADSYKS